MNDMKIRFGRPVMQGPAVDRLDGWRERNNAPRSDVDKWLSNLSEVHTAFFAAHSDLFSGKTPKAAD